jgi:hypothetical protein
MMDDLHPQEDTALSVLCLHTYVCVTNAEQSVGLFIRIILGE